MVLRICIIAMLLCTAAYTEARTFPTNIDRCHAGDVECIRKTTQHLVRKYATTGYPEAGFPRIEPLVLPRIDISDGRSSALNLKLKFTNMTVTGVSNAVIDRMVGFTKDPATSKFEIYGSFPKIDFHGKYEADGRILILPIQGDGVADINLIKPRFSIKFKPSIQQKHGQTFISIEKLKLLVEPEGLEMKLTNLFNGDKTLSENLLRFVNENWRDVWQELQPAIHYTIAEFIKGIAANVLKKYPYDEIYLED